MVKRLITRWARRRGYIILKLPVPVEAKVGAAPDDLFPIWPLPRSAGDFSDVELQEAFAQYPHWHYAFRFAGGLTFPTSHVRPGPYTDDPLRPLQRFRHFMPYLVEAAGGSLAGKRILDIACNSGFWSIQCALMGAEVVGFDARPELIAQANLLKRATGATTAEFRVLDFWNMSPDALGGTFDIVLNLGILYHLADPIEALALTKRMCRSHIVLDTAVHPSDDPVMLLKWEEPFDIRMAAEEGIVAVPSLRAIELILRQVGFEQCTRIPIRSKDLPHDYLQGIRSTWLLKI